jgi:hypothetical protein
LWLRGEALVAIRLGLSEVGLPRAVACRRLRRVGDLAPISRSRSAGIGCPPLSPVCRPFESVCRLR